MNHPLKVLYPEGGEHFLLMYRHHWDQWKAIVSRSKNTVESIYKKYVDGGEFADLGEFLQINIVAPPVEWHQSAIEFLHQENLERFFDHISIDVQVARNYGFAIPPEPFFLCNKFEPEEERDQDKFTTSYHYGCKNCKNKLSLSISKQELFDRYYLKYLQFKPDYQLNVILSNPIYKYSAASPASINDQIWYLSNQTGCFLREATFQNYPVHFFFTQIAELNTQELRNYCEKASFNYTKERKQILETQNQQCRLEQTIYYQNLFNQLFGK